MFQYSQILSKESAETLQVLSCHRWYLLHRCFGLSHVCHDQLQNTSLLLQIKIINRSLHTVEAIQQPSKSYNGSNIMLDRYYTLFEFTFFFML